MKYVGNLDIYYIFQAKIMIFFINSDAKQFVSMGKNYFFFKYVCFFFFSLQTTKNLPKIFHNIEIDVSNELAILYQFNAMYMHMMAFLPFILVHFCLNFHCLILQHFQQHVNTYAHTNNRIV